MADRIGIINQGRLVIVEEKKALMQKLGRKKLVINLSTVMSEIPNALLKFNMQLEDKGTKLVFIHDPEKSKNEISKLLDSLKENNISFKDINTYKSSLEEIFIQLVKKS
jgi:ABC-2 type transport system ATP-binding protein